MVAKFKNKRNFFQQGLTLIELMVAISVFTVVITGLMELFGSIFKTQLENLDFQQLLNSASFVSEYVPRALRLAQKDSNGDCISIINSSFENPDGNTSRIRFLNSEGKCQEFLKEGNYLKVRKSTDSKYQNLLSAQPLTAASILVENLIFQISGAIQEDNLQPKITIVLKIATTGQSPQHLNFQTTVSQRELDVLY